jgi:hypothetical protein
MELISIKDMPIELKKELLKKLGYSSDNIYVLDSNGNKLKDRYIDEEVKISNMIIVPGSTIILDNNPLSIACYLEEYNRTF